MIKDTSTSEDKLLANSVSEAFDYYGLNTPLDASLRLVAYVRLIQKWNQTYNLTAIKKPQDILTHHIFDSLSVLNATDEFFAERGNKTPNYSMLEREQVSQALFSNC